MKSHSEAFDELIRLYLEEHRKKYPAIPDSYRAIPKFEDKTTNGLTKCIITFLRLKGHHVERTGNEGRIVDNRQTVTDIIGRQRIIGSINRIPSSGMNGTSDLKCCLGGRFIAIEIKNKQTNDKQRPTQAAYQQIVENSGGEYVIATSLNQFVGWYNSFCGRGNNG